MKTFMITFCVALFIFGFVRDYNEAIKKKSAERLAETKVVGMWIDQLKNGTDIASRTKKGVYYEVES